MTRNITLFALLAATALLLLSGCLKDECKSKRTFVRFDPVYKSIEEIRAGFRAEGPRALENPGKIYAFDQYIFINERREGVHVIDNSDPANPQPIAFWAIPGNADIAIRGNYLYADQYIDLLTIDISNLQNPTLVCRKEFEFSAESFDPYRGYLVDYEETEITEEIDCADDRANQQWFWRDDVIFFDAAELDNSGGSLPVQAGVGGSFARFGLNGPYLYTIDKRNLRSYSLSDPVCPNRLDSVLVAWEIETIFPWKNWLFIGAPNGVYIFNASNPAKPELSSTFRHATGCDPVVCDDKYAYVTIHDGTTCNGSINQLDIIGIEHLPATALLASYNLKRPMGLAVTNTHLYVCDDGLKVFEKNNPQNLREVAHLSHIITYDVIALDQTHLLIIGDGGFYQYDVSNPEQPLQISFIPVAN